MCDDSAKRNYSQVKSRGDRGSANKTIEQPFRGPDGWNLPSNKK